MAKTAKFQPYDRSNSEVELHKHSGERVTILGPYPLDHDEFTMSHVRFPDGSRAEVFDDELSDWEGE